MMLLVLAIEIATVVAYVSAGSSYQLERLPVITRFNMFCMMLRDRWCVDAQRINRPGLISSDNCYAQFDRFKSEEMLLVLAIKIATIVAYASAVKTIEVSSYNCGGDLNIDDEETIILKYLGPRLNRPPCKYDIETDTPFHEMCVSVTKFEIACDTKVVLNPGIFTDLTPDKEYDCRSNINSDWCSPSKTINVAFVRDYNGRSRMGNVELKIYAKESSFFETDASDDGIKVTVLQVAAVFAVVVIIGLIIFTNTVMIMRCRRRRRRAAYRSPQQPIAITETYQAPLQPEDYLGYQLPLQEHQPSQPPAYGTWCQSLPQEQPGYQSSSQGYQPAQARDYGDGYPSTSQDYGSDYPPEKAIIHSPPDKSANASAPPLPEQYQMSEIEEATAIPWHMK